MRAYRYPAAFTQADEGGFVVTLPDVPKAIAQGEIVEHAIEQAVDALEEAIIGRIRLAERLRNDENEVRRLLDPRHSSKLPRIAEILERTGKHVVISVERKEDLLPESLAIQIGT